MFEIYWTPKATKQLLKLKNTQATASITLAVAELANFPDCQNVKSLTNHDYQYRLRVGNYRVFFNVENGVTQIIAIQEVKKRDERTY